jgi:heme-degrading monooxygenase HmoA
MNAGQTPTAPQDPPYFAVIFTSLRRSQPDDGYGETADRMLELAAKQPGYLGVDSARDESGLGITVSYWADEESIANWRRDVEHTLARAAGRDRWYQTFAVHVAKVERAYGFVRND